MNPAPRLRYVLHGKDKVIGFLASAGVKGTRAYDVNGTSLGLFDTEDLAAKAVYEQAAVSSD